MTSRFAPSIRHACRPLQPIPTDTSPRLGELSSIRVVLFDIYGTLLISSSGDLQSNHSGQSADAFTAAVAQVGLRVHCDGAVGVSHLQRQIEREHEQARADGIDYPEVDIQLIWKHVLSQLHDLGLVDATWPRVDVGQLAIEYELRANPVWPMPHAAECLARLHQAGFRLGLISNAQFLTIDLLHVLLGDGQDADFFWDADLQFFSYQHGRAKPGMGLFQLAVGLLREQGFLPSQVVYVGNDMLNDMWTGRARDFVRPYLPGINAVCAGDPMTHVSRSCSQTWC